MDMNETHTDNRDRALRLLEALLVTRFDSASSSVTLFSCQGLLSWRTALILLLIPILIASAHVYKLGSIEDWSVLLVITAIMGVYVFGRRSRMRRARWPRFRGPFRRHRRRRHPFSRRMDTCVAEGGASHGNVCAERRSIRLRALGHGIRRDRRMETCVVEALFSGMGTFDLREVFRIRSKTANASV